MKSGKLITIKAAVRLQDTNMTDGPIKYFTDFFHLHDEATAHKKKKKKKKKVSYNRRDYRGVEGAVEDAEKGKK